ncbi:MAG TPA: hypothetical protein VFG51_03920 [Candidatus Saccharimonadia bacterium]|nr:hypothetical protein [Candidatus Saccharimonadia bacterium]
MAELESDSRHAEHLLRDLITASSSLLLLAVAAEASFSFDRRVAIRTESRGICEICGKKVGVNNVIASHWNHARNTHYDDRENGIARCGICETSYHLKFANNPGEIGLTTEKNDWSVLANMTKLKRYQRREIQVQYPRQWASVMRRTDGRMTAKTW